VIFDLPKVDPLQLPISSLAYIGDGVMNLHFRLRFLNLYKPSEIEKVVRRFVSKEGQARALDALWKKLSDDERNVAKRGMNSRSATRHGNDPLYRKSTGLEALIGYLYVTGRERRLREIFDEIVRIQGQTR